MDRGVFTTGRLRDRVRCFGYVGLKRFQHVNSDDGRRPAIGVHRLHQDDHGSIMWHGAYSYEWREVCEPID